MKNGKPILPWIGRFAVLLILYYLFFIGGSQALVGVLPDVPSEPGPLPAGISFLLLGVANTSLVIALILSSRWSGWKLAGLLALAYYGAVTLLTQIETAYFLSGITVDRTLVYRLLLMGIPVAFVFVPLAVWILGKGRSAQTPEPAVMATMPVQQWAGKLALIAVAYVALYWAAGYFIAWQNPTLRAFYGSPGEILPFWEHTANTLRDEPGLLPFQVFRALLWTLCALPVILGSQLNRWRTALLVGLFFTLPQLLGLLLENPLMPSASVRMSHLIEGACSNFIFGVILVWLLYREPAAGNRNVKQ